MSAHGAIGTARYLWASVTVDMKSVWLEPARNLKREISSELLNERETLDRMHVSLSGYS